MTIEGGIRNGSMMDTDAARIMIVAQSGALYQSLAHTLEERLRGCHALICQAGAAVARSEGDIRLILIHASCHPCCSGTGVEREIEAQRALYPTAAIAILIDSMETLTPHCCDLFAAQKVQGILPMTLKLEVWLAAVLLLLSGGEYYPAPSRREAVPAPAPQSAEPAATAPAPAEAAPESAAKPAAPPQPAPAAAVPAPAAAPPPAALSSLTAREQEILELLSEGHQNKLIAHKMSLSEHTVKVHVHNLLAKLRVSNRTQAAATYRKGQMTALGMVPPIKAPDANGAGAAAAW